MTTVFGFLILLVLVMNLSAALFERLGEPAEPPVPPATPAAAGPGPEIAVVLAAVHAHRRSQP